MHIDLNSRSFCVILQYGKLHLPYTLTIYLYFDQKSPVIELVQFLAVVLEKLNLFSFFSFLQTLSCSAALRLVLKRKYDCPTDICLLFLCVKLLLMSASVHNSSQSNFSLTTKYFWRTLSLTEVVLYYSRRKKSILNCVSNHRCFSLYREWLDVAVRNHHLY